MVERDLRDGMTDWKTCDRAHIGKCASVELWKVDVGEVWAAVCELRKSKHCRTFRTPESQQSVVVDFVDVPDLEALEVFPGISKLDEVLVAN